jgi:hypothetical protein
VRCARDRSRFIASSKLKQPSREELVELALRQHFGEKPRRDAATQRVREQHAAVLADRHHVADD